MKCFALLPAVWLALTLAMPCRAQSAADGLWYSYTARGVLELQLSKRYMVLSRRNWDFSREPGFRSDSALIHSIIPFQGTLYFLTMPKFRTGLRLSSIRILDTGSCICAFIYGQSRMFEDTIQVLDYIQLDQTTEYCLNFYSPARMVRFEELPHAATMPRDTLLEYMEGLIRLREELAEISQPGQSPPGLAEYRNHKYRDLLAELGYNPLISEEELLRLFQYFARDPELRPWLDELRPPGKP